MRLLTQLSERSVEKAITIGNGAGKPEGFLSTAAATVVR